MAEQENHLQTNRTAPTALIRMHTGRTGLDSELPPPQSEHKYLRAVRQAA